MTTPLPLSVIVPNYNSGKYLSECIGSINRGAYPAQLLIVDDGSTDGSLPLAEQLAREHSNIEVVRMGTNRGAAAARREGIEASSGEWIAFVDADDRLEEGALADAFSRACADDADLCVWQLWRFDDTREWPHLPLDPDDFPMTGRTACLRTLGGWRMHPLGVARRTLYETAYKGFEARSYNADELLTRRALDAANQVVLSDKRYMYRHNEGSISNTLHPRRLGVLASQLWLVEFCVSRGYGSDVASLVARNTIGYLWWAFRNRHRMGQAESMQAIQDTVVQLRGILEKHDIKLGSVKHYAMMVCLYHAANIALHKFK